MADVTFQLAGSRRCLRLALGARASDPRDRMNKAGG